MSTHSVYPAPATVGPVPSAARGDLRQPWRDLAIVACITAATFVVGSALEISENLGRLARNFEAYQLDELPVTLAAMLLGLTWYSWRRHRQAVRELNLRLSAQRALTENQEQYRALFTDDLSANVLADARGIVRLANPEAARLLGLPAPESAVGRSISEFYADPEEWAAQLERVAREDKVEASNVELLQPGGGRRRAIARLTARRRPTGALEVHAFFADVTPLEEARARLSVTLAENRELVRRSIQVQEEERRHIARELHDEMGQWLNALKLDAVSIRDGADAAPDVRAAAQSIVDVTNHVYDVARNLMRRLRPVALDELGLPAALQYLADQWRRRQPEVRCRFSAEGALEGLGEVTNITIYRLVQECLTNVTKHAGASEVDIVLRHDTVRGRVEVRVSDDGRGLATERTAFGMGLLGLRERFEVLGGSFDVAGPEGEGVTVTAWLPVVARDRAGIPVAADVDRFADRMETERAE
jgi:PAS domain S-box-containing protein